MPASQLKPTNARRTRERLREERGIILPLSIMILSVILILALVVATSAVDSNTTAGKQLYADQALATAEAGLQTAFHRVHATEASGGEVGASECFTTANAGAVGVSGEGCKNHAGEGEVGEFKYTYYNEPLTSSTKFNCVGAAYLNATISQRCITATATVHGVTRRVQERVIAGAEALVLNGFESLGAISINNKSELAGPVTANGSVTLGGGVKATGTITGEKVTCSEKCTKVEAKESVKVPTVKGCAQEWCESAYEAAREHNAAEELPEPLKANYKAERNLKDAATVGSEAAPIELKSGSYNFCEFSFTQNVYLKIAKGSTVKLYIDSSNRPGSKCAKFGEVSATNGFCINNENENPANLKFFMWGDPSKISESKFSFTNGVGHCGSTIPALVAEVFAPYSIVEATNGGSFGGKVYAGEIKATNGLNLVTTTSSSSGSNVFAPTAWTICNRSQPTGNSNPASGCY